MTGMTTTPHLHIQVDNDEAPFYPYWPFDYKQASDAGLNMYEAVDAGLNQDLILKYSVDPIDFIKKATTIDGPSVASESIPKNDTGKTNTAEVKPIQQNTNNGIFKDLSTSSSNYKAIAYLNKK